MAARHYLVDFDGTIVQEDSLDLLFHGHADPAWLDYDSRWERGEIGSRENLSFALSTFSLSEPILRQVVSQLSLDPGFLDFLGWISLEGSSCTILSEGIDFIIWETLKAAFLTSDVLNVVSNHFTGSRIDFLDNQQGCPLIESCKLCSLCKYSVVAASSPGNERIYIGDGLSDRFGIIQADRIYAKKKLLNHCKNIALTARPFDTFYSILEMERRRVLGR